MGISPLQIRQQRQRLDIPDRGQIEVRIAGNIGRIEHMLAIWRNSRMAVGPLPVKGATVIGQDPRPDVLITLQLVQQDKGPGGTGVDPEMFCLCS